MRSDGGWRWRVGLRRGNTGENFVFWGANKRPPRSPPLLGVKGPGGCLNAVTSPSLTKWARPQNEA
jgi:hypothetical protein